MFAITILLERKGKEMEVGRDEAADKPDDGFQHSLSCALLPICVSKFQT